MQKFFHNRVTSVLLSVVIAGVLVLLPTHFGAVYAEDSLSVGDTIKQNLINSSVGLRSTTLGTQDNIGSVVGLAVSAILALMGLVFLILILYGGILWMTSEGEPDKVKKARGLIFHAVIGLIIVLGAFAITAFVLRQIATPITGQ
ncbi:MAG: hypothetical protein Q8P11_04135 [bacterium]|nr:hypothetical protein [bacterium]